MTKLILSLIVSLICVSEISAQRACGNELLSKREAAIFPHQTEDNRKVFKTWKAEKEASGRSAAPVTIPVHIIVVHGLFESEGQGDNIDLERINSQLQVLNDDFGRTNADAGNTPSVFDAAATEISFCLATVDPNGNATSGITRYPTGNDFQDIEDTIIEETIWPPTRYLNIYLAPELDGLLGYSSRPNPGQLPQTNNDVVRVLTGSFGGEGYATAAPYDLGRTATHEIGHWLGLRHVWGNGGCTSDDGFDDTPSQTDSNFGCPNHPSASCNNGGDMFMNYMDYVNDNCMNAFTAEQAAFMEMIIEGTRTELLTSASTACLPSGAPIVSLVNKTDIKCPGDISGSIELTATSGTAPYTYSLDGGPLQVDGIFSNIPGGDHVIVVTESEGITSEYNFTINEPPAQVFDIQVSDESCLGSSDGSVVISSTGGNESFKSLMVFSSTFSQTQSFLLNEGFTNGIPNGWVADNDWLWGNSNELSSTYFDFPSNEHFMGFNDDSFGAGAVNSGSLTSPNIQLNGVNQFSVLFDIYFANGDYDGFDETAKVYFSGDDGVNWQEVADLPGSTVWTTYSVEVNDYLGTSIKLRFEYDDGAGWNFGLGVDNVSIQPQSVGEFDNLSAGNYNVVFIDGEDCEYNASFEIIANDPISILEVVSTNPGCGGLGYIEVGASSTNGINQYELNGITNTTGAFDVSGGGSYTITVTDNAGCTKETTVMLVDEGGISLSANGMDVTCNGGQNGAFEIEVSGNQGATEITLDGTIVNATMFENLLAGDYTVSVSDEAGCNASLIYTISEPTALAISGNIVNQSCVALGSITLTASGGVAPYTYSGDFGDLPTGTYSAIVTDANGCMAVASFSIGADFALTQITETLISCSTSAYLVEFCTDDGTTADWTIYDDQGVQILDVGNGACVDIDMGPFLNSVTEDFFYAVEASSANGCVSGLNTVANQPSVLNLDPISNLVLCGSDGIELFFDNVDEFESIEIVDQDGNSAEVGDNIFILEGGNTYTINTTDLNGCTDESQLTILLEESPIASIGSITDATSSTGGTIELEVTGGSGPYTFTVNGETNETGIFEDLPPADYTALIENIYGCTTEIDFTIQMETATKDLTISSEIILFPNPVNTTLTISIGDNKIIDELWIYRIDGLEMKYQITSTPDSLVDVSNLGSGVYFIMIKAGDELGVKRFIKI